MTVFAFGIWGLFWLWTRKLTGIETVLAGVLIFVLGHLVMSQNSQMSGMPVRVVIFLLAYAALSRSQAVAERPMPGLTLVLTGLLLSPMVSIVSHTATLVGYYRAASRTNDNITVERTNLRGLAVPLDEAEPVFGNQPHEFATPMRPTPPGMYLTQQQYIESLLEAAVFLQRSGEGHARVLVFDQVNPMPFTIGAPPPRGGPLWLWPQAPPLPAEAVLGDTEIVLIPKYAIDPTVVLAMLDTYSAYLSDHFPVREDMGGWTLLRRTSPARS